MITSIYFENFKTLSKFSISLKRFNILVGINNSGKSTILDALRILEGAYRYASRYKPSLKRLPNGRTVYGWEIPDSSIPIILENIQTDFSEEPAIIRYRFRDGSYLIVYFYKEKQTVLSFELEGDVPKTAVAFRKRFNLNLAIVPTLSPFEIEENLVDDQYLNRWGGSRRASRLFRNIWYSNSEYFHEFRQKVEESWQGMSISKPEKPDVFSKRLVMFFHEKRIPREICWAGFGFQVWLQLLTHIIKNKNSDIIVIDEPEIYLHPDLQHKILQILHETDAIILLATHSSEIINEAEPNEVVIIDKKYNSAKRLNNIIGLQAASDLIGSSQNMNLTRLARGRRILFVEGKDLKLLSKLCKVANYQNLFEKSKLTVIPIEGFSQNERISGTVWTFSKIISEKVKIMALFDRDYRCQEEINAFKERLNKEIEFVHVLERKEIENYFLSVVPITKTINQRLKQRMVKTLNDDIAEYTQKKTEQVLLKLTDRFKEDVSSQLASNKYKHLMNTGIDLATVISQEQKEFERNWERLSFRLKVIPGKEFISLLNKYLQEEDKISITFSQICDHLNKSDLGKDIVGFFNSLSSISE